MVFIPTDRKSTDTKSLLVLRGVRRESEAESMPFQWAQCDKSGARKSNTHFFGLWGALDESRDDFPCMFLSQNQGRSVILAVDFEPEAFSVSTVAEGEASP